MPRQHLFLSPHPDDAILSCGGLIYALAQQGDAVSVFTLMAQEAPVDVRQKPFIQALHQRWGGDDEPFALRRAEDEAACKLLGVDNVIFGDWHDAIYRTDEAGELLYISDDDLFGDVKPADQLINATLDTDTWTGVTDVYVPLAAGNHVDHQAVRDAALRSNWHHITWHFYEDYPYSASSDEVFYTHGGTIERLHGPAAIEYARSKITWPLKRSVQKMSRDAIEAKINAIAHYQSQISSFWPSVADMRTQVQQYHQQIGKDSGLIFAESYWILPEDES